MAKKLTSSKAKEILHDKSVHGHPLTDKQRKFFGAIAGGAKPYKAEQGGWLDEFDMPQAQNGIEGTMGGLTDVGFNYNGAWGGPSMQMGGSLPGSVGFTYARTGSTPSEGPYAKKTIPSAEDGMTFYQHGLDWTPRNISENGSEIPKAQVGERFAPPARESTAVRMFDPLSGRQFSTATTGMTAEQMEQVSNAVRADKRAEKEEIKKRVNERKAAKNAVDLGRPFTFPTGERKKYKDMNWREKSYVSGLALQQRGKINENDEAWYDDINPVNWLTEIAGGLGTAPLEAKMYDSNLPYIGAIVDPLIQGALGFDPLGSALKVPGKVAQSMESGVLSKFIPKKEYLELAPLEEYSFTYTPPVQKDFIPTAFDKDVKKQAFDYLKLTQDPRYLERVKALDAEARAAGYESNLEDKLLKFHKQGESPRNIVVGRTQQSYFPFNIKTVESVPYVDEYGAAKDALGRANLSSEGFKKWVVEGPESIKGLKFKPEYGEIEINTPRHIKGNIPSRGTVHHELKHHWTNKLLDEPYYANLLKSITVPEEANAFLPRKDFQYFTKPTEIDAHIMTNMRDEMVQKGILKDHFDELTKDKLNKFIKENPSYRGITEYFKPGKEIVWDRNKFISSFNKALPVAIPGIIGAATLQGQEQTPQQKKGGVIKDDRGQWAHPGEITEIGSNNITMQGVPYPVLGISDEGDVQMMFPGKDYKFKGKKVTEIPMAQKGKEVPPKIYTDYKEYLKAKKGGWLDEL